MIEGAARPPMTDARTRARELLAAATKGPWKLSGGYVHNRKSVLVEAVPQATRKKGYAVAWLGDDAQTWKDGELIAAAPELLTALCDELDAARAQVARLREALKECRDLAAANRVGDVEECAAIALEENER